MKSKLTIDNIKSLYGHIWRTKDDQSEYSLDLYDCLMFTLIYIDKLEADLKVAVEALDRLKNYSNENEILGSYLIAADAIAKIQGEAT